MISKSSCFCSCFCLVLLLVILLLEIVNIQVSSFLSVCFERH